MILLGLAVFWFFVIAGISWHFFSSARATKSVKTFEEGRHTLRRHGYSVPPAHIVEDEAHHVEAEAIRPRLRVVRDDVAETNEDVWAEWGREHGVAVEAPVARPRNPYAAYKATPTAELTMHLDEPLPRRVSMKVRRTRIFAGLLGSAIVFSLLNMVAGLSLLGDVAVLAWIGLVGFVVLALVAISLGYLNQPSFMTRRTPLASVTTLEPVVEDEEFYDADDTSDWRREPVRRALG